MSISGSRRGESHEWPDGQRLPRDALRKVERVLNAASVRVSEVYGRNGLQEARAQSLRITFTIENSEVWLRNNCSHDQAYRRHA